MRVRHGFEANLYPEKDQQKRLQAGILRMHKNFVWQLCPVCRGSGYGRNFFHCGCCNGWGLWNGSPAPRSVVAQVLEAAP